MGQEEAAGWSLAQTRALEAPGLRRFLAEAVRQRGSSWADAGQVAAEAVHEGIPPADTENAVGWFVRTAQNAVRNHLRTERRHGHRHLLKKQDTLQRPPVAPLGDLVLGLDLARWSSSLSPRLQRYLACRLGDEEPDCSDRNMRRLAAELWDSWDEYQRRWLVESRRTG